MDLRGLMPHKRVVYEAERRSARFAMSRFASEQMVFNEVGRCLGNRIFYVQDEEMWVREAIRLSHDNRWYGTRMRMFQEDNWPPPTPRPSRNKRRNAGPRGRLGGQGGGG